MTPIDGRGAPVQGRGGESLSYRGQPVIAGYGSFEMRLSARATAADLWATLDLAASAGRTALQDSSRPPLDQAAVARLRAYVQQARQYYDAVGGADPAAKPLIAYYFMLNATKAFITAYDSASTEALKLSHGAVDANSAILEPYSFAQENTQVFKDGVLPRLAAVTGRGHVWPHKSVIPLHQLIPYLVEGVDLYGSAFRKTPKLLPIRRAYVRGDGARPNQRGWLRIEVERLKLREYDLRPKTLLERSKVFGAQYKLVRSPEADSFVVYESLAEVPYSQMPKPLPELRTLYDRSLLLRNRSQGARDFIPLSNHPELVSSEAITFTVMLHLSNMVRYRPQHVNLLRGTSYWWLFTSWVDRACENFLLSISSRISLEEHLIY
jgi:hypothetical protein